MTTTAQTFIPFGKYRGRPVAVLLEDTNYCRWLIEQPWFHGTYPDLHQVILASLGGADDEISGLKLALRHALEALEQERMAHRSFRQMVYNESGYRQTVPLDKHLFTRLLTIAHPDKWQNQPAEKLAHELVVVINALREGVA